MPKENPDNTITTYAGDAIPPGRSLWADARRRIWKSTSARICIFIIVFYTLIAIGATIYDYAAERSDNDNIITFKEMVDYKNKNLPPSLYREVTIPSETPGIAPVTVKKFDWKLIFGTDWAGKSVLIKTLLGAKVSMSVGLISNLISVPLGILLGVLAGYYGKKTDAIIVWVFSTLASIPGIILLIAIKFAFNGVKVFDIELDGIYGIYIAMGVVSWIGTCRLVRAETMKLRELDYVVAARASGRRNLAILSKHIVPNVMHIGIISFSLGFVGAVQGEVVLSYLGLGVKVGSPSWGTMINNARMQLFAGQWWELTAAVGAMFFLVLALNIFGDRLRDALDPRLKNV